jgi:hypothetical protein
MILTLSFSLSVLAGSDLRRRFVGETVSNVLLRLARDLFKIVILPAFPIVFPSLRWLVNLPTLSPKLFVIVETKSVFVGGFVSGFVGGFRKNVMGK